MYVRSASKSLGLTEKQAYPRCQENALWHSDLCFIAEYAGLTYQELIGRIMASFLKRHPELARRSAAA